MTAFRQSIVAVVDDDVRVLESLEELLESAGHSVRPFSSAKRLLEANALSEIDCLIADIGMPAMDGFELQRLAQAARPSLPVFLITARHELANQRRATAQGCQGYFQKPFNAQALLATVGKAIEDSRRGV
jgi:FixJ family two-component response regulator